VAHATTADFGGDVLAGVVYLKTHKEIHPKKIGLIGHREGGVIAPMCAAQSRDGAFIKPVCKRFCRRGSATSCEGGAEHWRAGLPGSSRRCLPPGK